MELSTHAQIRCKQRGISDDIINILLRHGRESFAPGGSQKLLFGRKEYGHVVKELKHLMKVLDRAKDTAMIVNKDQIITVYKQF